MRTGSRPRMWRRATALLAAPLLLAGCATPYALVQPGGAGSGSYYTGTGVYSGQTYYGGYASGPYYSGSIGYGYGGYGYGGYSYWPGYGFNLGIYNRWNYPGYYGWPWYTTVYTGCNSWRCHGHHHGHDGHDHEGGAKPWLKPDRPRVPRVARNGNAPPVAVRSGPMARPPVDRAALPQGFVRAAGAGPAARERIERRLPPPTFGAGRVANMRAANPGPPPRIAVPPRATQAPPVRSARPAPPPRAAPPPTVIRNVQPAPPVRPATRSRNTPAVPIR